MLFINNNSKIIQKEENLQTRHEIVWIKSDYYRVKSLILIHQYFLNFFVFIKKIYTIIVKVNVKFRHLSLVYVRFYILLFLESFTLKNCSRLHSSEILEKFYWFDNFHVHFVYDISKIAFKN